MPRKRKPSPIKDIYLAAKMQGIATQLNIPALEDYLNSAESDLFSYKEELRATIEYARTLQQKGNNHANQPVS
jgi:hypothetical protein